MAMIPLIPQNQLNRQRVKSETRIIKQVLDDTFLSTQNSDENITFPTSLAAVLVIKGGDSWFDM